MTTARLLAETVVVTGPFTSLRFAALADDRGDVRVVMHAISTMRTDYLATIRPNRLRALARALTSLAAELGERP